MKKEFIQHYDLFPEDDAALEVCLAVADGEKVVGFVYSVDKKTKSVEVILWEPTIVKMNKRIRSRKTLFNDHEVYEKFKEAFEAASPFVKEGWLTAVKNSIQIDE